MEPNPKPASSSLPALVTLPLLLILPALAVYRGFGPAIGAYVAGWITAISLLTAVVTWLDKRKARQQEWREPEAMLHLAELLGGWPGGFLAQRFLRHKTSKLSYQVVFWFIVILYQTVAIDWLLGWPIAGAIRASLAQAI